jgi:hypothetical protein
MMDTHAFVLESGRHYSGLTIDGIGFSEAVKGSNLVDTTVEDLYAIGGDEDCIDCVRGSNYTFRDVRLVSSGTNTFITLKGGIDGCILEDVTLLGDTKYPWDVSLGDHTIYNKGRLMMQKNIILRNVRRADDKPVRVFVMDSEPPTVENSNVRIYRVPKLLVKLWFLVKR